MLQDKDLYISDWYQTAHIFWHRDCLVRAQTSSSISPWPPYDMTSLILRRALPLLGSLALVLPSLGSAQAPVLGIVDFNGDISSNGAIGGFAVGPYKADLTGFNAQFGLNGTAPLSNVIIWCVDWNNAANNNADSYYSTAFTTNLNGIIGNGDFSKTRNGAQTNYAKAAWLIEQYDAGITGFTAVNVQGTIWNMMGANFTGFSDKLGVVPVDYASKLTRNWYVLSDDNVGNEVSNQEYLTSSTVVPEPSTYALMGAGLLALGVVSRRRRNAARTT